VFQTILLRSNVIGSGRNLRLVPKEIRLGVRVLIAIFIATMPVTMKDLSPNQFVLLLASVHLFLVILDFVGRLPRDKKQWNETSDYSHHHGGACPHHRQRYRHQRNHTNEHKHIHTTDSSQDISLVINDSVESEGGEGEEDTPLITSTIKTEQN
jgi:hypothetical protein